MTELILYPRQLLMQTIAFILAKVLTGVNSFTQPFAHQAESTITFLERAL